MAMDSISLHTARRIMQIIASYSGPMKADTLIESVSEITGDTPEVITKVIEFLQEVRGVEVKIETAPAPSSLVPAAIDTDTPLNLMDELSYNYRVAKVVLETSLVAGRTIDAEETRKSLRTISSFMEQALKLQERLYNAQQIQKFQDAVLDTLNDIEPELRDRVLERLL